MSEEVTILEDDAVERSCATCGIHKEINEQGPTFASIKLVQTKCLFCKWSKNASMIRGVHAKIGVNDGGLEDNWVNFEE